MSLLCMFGALMIATPFLLFFVFICHFDGFKIACIVFGSTAFIFLWIVCGVLLLERCL